MSDVPRCSICNAEKEPEECWQCFGEGYFDLYEMNPIEFEPSETETCDECHGTGWYWQCPNVPHEPKTKSPPLLIFP